MLINLPMREACHFTCMHACVSVTIHTQETGVNPKAVFIKYNPNPSQPGKGQ